jgi:hypothetical protein
VNEADGRWIAVLGDEHSGLFHVLPESFYVDEMSDQVGSGRWSIPALDLEKLKDGFNIALCQGRTLEGPAHYSVRRCINMWRELLRDDPTQWLLEEDSTGVRHLAFHTLFDAEADERERQQAKHLAHQEGPIADMLRYMNGEGFWVEPGPGYLPKYRSTVWSLILLAQLGAQIEEDERIDRASRYILDHALNPDGQFSISGPPSGTVDCLQGNLLAALLDLGCEDDRLDQAFEWMARTVTGEGLAPNTDRKALLRYYAGKCGPDFACGANNKLPCAWGAAKVMLAFSKLPLDRRTPLIESAIERGVNFLFSVDPATAEYPSGWAKKPSSNWWKFGFPIFYVTDILQIVEALGLLGFGEDKRLNNAIALILEKQDDQGRWPLEYEYSGKTWVDFGPKKQPSKWVTLRALKTLKSCAA